MSAQLSDVRLWHLFDKQYGDGLVVCIYHHEYVWRQSAAVLVRGADNVALAQGTSGDSAISDALDLLKNRVACVSAADLAAAQSSARLTWPPTVTLVVVVRAMSTASPRVFGPEGQYGPAVEDMVRQHAQANGAHRVVALVARVCDDPMQDAHRVAPKTFAEDWRRDARWPYVTHAAYISDLRLRTTDERIALFKRIPQATRLPFAIPTLALDTSPSPHLLAARSTSSTAAPNVAWSLLLTATGIDLQSLMSGDGSSSLSAKANPLVAHPVGHSSLRVWRAAPFPSTEPVGTDCVVAVNVDMWSEQLAAWRLVNVLDLPAVVAAGESGRVARVSLSLGVDSPLFVPPSIDLGDSRSGSPNRGMSDSIRRSSSSSLIEQRLSITRTLDLEVPIVDPINAFINLTGAAMSSSPLRRLAIADAAVKSVSQRLPSNAPEVQQLEELSEMIAQIENSSDGGRALLEQRRATLLQAAEARALISERNDIEFRRAMQRHHELSRTDRTVKCLLPFYSAVLDLRSLRAAARGWSLYWASDDVRTRSDKLVARPLAVLGREKVGKSWLVSKLSGSALPDEKLHTMGLCVQTMHDSSSSSRSPGASSVPFLVFDVAGDGVAVRPELEQDQRATESFLRRVAASLSGDTVLYVCNKFDNMVQSEIDALYSEVRARNRGVSDEHLNVIVVHNVLTIGSAYALQQYKLELLRLLNLTSSVVEVSESDSAALGSLLRSPSGRSIASMATGDPIPSIMYINGQKHLFFVSEVGGALANGLMDEPWCTKYNDRMTKLLSQYLANRVRVVKDFALRARLLATLREYLPDYWADYDLYRLVIESAADVVLERQATSGAATATMPHDVITVHGLNGEPVTPDRLMSLHPDGRTRGHSEQLHGFARIEQRFEVDWAHVYVDMAGRDDKALTSGEVMFSTAKVRDDDTRELRITASTTGNIDFGALQGGMFVWKCPRTHIMPIVEPSQWTTLKQVRVNSESDNGTNEFACNIVNGRLEVFLRLSKRVGTD